MKKPHAETKRDVIVNTERVYAPPVPELPGNIVFFCSLLYPLKE